MSGDKLPLAISIFNEVQDQSSAVYHLLMELESNVKGRSLTVEEATRALDCVAGFQKLLESKELDLAAYKGAEHFEAASATLHTMLEIARTESVYVGGRVGRGLTPEARLLLEACKNANRDDQSFHMDTLVTISWEVKSHFVDLAMNLIPLAGEGNRLGLARS